MTSAERDKLLKTLWQDNVPVQQIARRLKIGTSQLHVHRVRLGLLRRDGRTWPDAKIAAVKALWVQGKSATEIAAELNDGTTRNAVIGLAHRNGWTKDREQKPSTPKAPRVRKPKAEATEKKPAKDEAPITTKPIAAHGMVTGVAFPPLPLEQADKKRAEFAAEGKAVIERVEAVTIQSPGARPFLEAKRGCKWPIGSGLSMLYCCNPVVGGVGAAKVYCEGHRAMAVSSVAPYRARDAVSTFTRNERRRTPKPEAANDPFGAAWDDTRAVA